MNIRKQTKHELEQENKQKEPSWKLTVYAFAEFVYFRNTHEHP